jgi:hypothetical protein
MISNNDYTTEPISLTLPTNGVYPANCVVPDSALEPFETELRNRLHDILEQWEIEANESGDPEQIFTMIDQISDAMYPPEDAE